MKNLILLFLIGCDADVQALQKKAAVITQEFCNCYNSKVLDIRVWNNGFEGRCVDYKSIRGDSSTYYSCEYKK